MHSDTSEAVVVTSIGPVTLPAVEAELMRPMAVVLDDPNEIHLDPAVVRALGYGDRTINQGPANCGYVIDVLRAQFSEKRLERFTARFLGNVFSGDVLTVNGTVRPGDEGVLHCSVVMENQDGTPVLAADARLAEA